MCLFISEQPSRTR